jgi:hypothetical protein
MREINVVLNKIQRSLCNFMFFFDELQEEMPESYCAGKRFRCETISTMKRPHKEIE